MKALYGWLRIREALLVLSVCAIVLAFVSVACDSSNALTEKEVSESLAKFALRAYCETQEAYRYNNWYDNYGDWDSLVEGHFISGEYSRGNIIKNYSMWTGVFSLPIYGASVYAPSTFTGVAFPHAIGPPGYLSTFSIREDRILRVYVPDVVGMNAWNENGDCGTKTWEETE